MHVSLDRPFRQDQLLGDLPVRHAGGEKCGDLALPRGSMRLTPISSPVISAASFVAAATVGAMVEAAGRGTAPLEQG